jgi:formylglycine-generating enzyme required for sulfatase activity
MGNNPSHFSATRGGAERVKGLNTDHFPVDSVSWKAAMAFSKKLSAVKAEQQARRTYRLPTEAEWEYACRGGPCSSTLFHFGSDLSALGNLRHDFAEAGSRDWSDRTYAVGQFPANAFGLHDMHGNVYEWCSDRHDEEYYSKSPRRDPPGPAWGSDRVVRGGHDLNDAAHCCAAFRGCIPRGEGFCFTGFRAVLVPAEEPERRNLGGRLLSRLLGR